MPKAAAGAAYRNRLLGENINCGGLFGPSTKWGPPGISGSFVPQCRFSGAVGTGEGPDPLKSVGDQGLYLGFDLLRVIQIYELDAGDVVAGINDQSAVTQHHSEEALLHFNGVDFIIRYLHFLIGKEPAFQLQHSRADDQEFRQVFQQVKQGGNQAYAEHQGERNVPNQGF